MKKKTVQEWCATCLFTEIKMHGKKYWQPKDCELPKESDCLQCLYEKVSQLKITKPKKWGTWDETSKVLADKSLMKAIRKARKEGSHSSPYKPLA
jgi:hypothetical protein